MRQKLLGSFSWEKLCIDTRTVVLLALFSLLSTGHTKNSSTYPCVENASIEHKSFLDDFPVLDKSLLYYFFAKNPQGEQAINEQCFAITHDYWSLIQGSAQKYDIDPYLVAGVILLESWWDPKAHSIAWAKWLMQMLRGTAQQYGWYYRRKGKLTDKRIDPEWSITTWCKHLSYLYKKFDSWSLAVAAYHMGEGNIERKLQKIYYQETGTELKSMDTLYNDVPPTAVIDFLFSRKDDTFGYYAKVCNAKTIIHMYQEDCRLFDQYVSMYKDIDYDLRWIVAENVVFTHEPINSDADIQDAIAVKTMCLVDDHNFLCQTWETENAFHPSVQSVITLIDTLVQFPFILSYWTISDEYYNQLDSLTQVDKRHDTHRTGYVFDISSTELSSQEKNIMMYVLTILRYKGVLLWCREHKNTDREHYHVAVLPDAWKHIDNIYNEKTLSFSVSVWEK